MLKDRESPGVGAHPPAGGAAVVPNPGTASLVPHVGQGGVVARPDRLLHRLPEQRLRRRGLGVPGGVGAHLLSLERSVQQRHRLLNAERGIQQGHVLLLGLVTRAPRAPASRCCHTARGCGTQRRGSRRGVHRAHTCPAVHLAGQPIDLGARTTSASRRVAIDARVQCSSFPARFFPKAARISLMADVSPERQSEKRATKHARNPFIGHPIRDIAGDCGNQQSCIQMLTSSAGQGSVLLNRDQSDS